GEQFSELRLLFFVFVIARQGNPPNVSWFIEFDSAVQWVVRIDVDNPSRCMLIRHVNVNRNFHLLSQFHCSCNQGTMKADHDGLAIACLTLSTSLHRDNHLQRNTSAASAASGTSEFVKRRHDDALPRAAARSAPKSERLAQTQEPRIH